MDFLNQAKHVKHDEVRGKLLEKIEKLILDTRADIQKVVNISPQSLNLINFRFKTFEQYFKSQITVDLFNGPNSNEWLDLFVSKLDYLTNPGIAVKNS